MEKVQKSFHSFNDEAIKNPKGPCAQTIIKGGPVHHLQVESREKRARKEVTIGHFRPKAHHPPKERFLVFHFFLRSQIFLCSTLRYDMNFSLFVCHALYKIMSALYLLYYLDS